MKAYERLLKYVSYPTASDETSDTCPSTSEQNTFGLALCEEMKEIGIEQVRIDGNGYVYGTVPASPGKDDELVVGFIAHMDVVREVPYWGIRPKVVDYQGGDVTLSEELGILLSPREFPEMKACVGRHLVVTDGTTLLGADDKAGIAEILTAAESLIGHPEIPHGKIQIAFTPDEEIGRGADRFDLTFFAADFAYTMDGGAFGGVESETFNAAHAHIKIHGRSVHPGSAKNVMKNASLIAMEFHSLLPALERPENTEGYEGYYHLIHLNGACEEAGMDYILRDHDEAKLERKVEVIRKAAEEINRRYGAGTAVADTGYDYKNMRVVIERYPHLIDTAYEAIREVGGEPESVAVRGGTDGCVLSFKGLPCPNLGTGGYNFHGKYEFACVEEMDLAVETILKIAEKYADFKK